MNDDDDYAHHISFLNLLADAGIHVFLMKYALNFFLSPLSNFTLSACSSLISS